MMRTRTWTWAAVALALVCLALVGRLASADQDGVDVLDGGSSTLRSSSNNVIPEDERRMLQSGNESESDSPTTSPSKNPTTKPSKNPTTTPSMNPTTAPSQNPTKNPTSSPSKRPTSSPSRAPTTSPSLSPSTSKPSAAPSKSPSTSTPTLSPTHSPSLNPTTSSPSMNPTSAPSLAPSTSMPSQSPTTSPTTSAPTRSPTPYGPTNVLLILSDDLKPLANAFGSPFTSATSTPNMDKLIQNGVSFMNAHSQMAICGPSRASMLTSLRPDILKIYGLDANSLGKKLNNRVQQRKKSKKAKDKKPKLYITLPELFKKAGYRTYGVGKIFHENEHTLMLSPNVWTVPVYTWRDTAKRASSFTTPYRGTWMDNPEVDDTFFPDGQAATLAAELIRDVLAPDRTTGWFLAVGFWKPHVPWSAPKKYFDKCPPPEQFHTVYLTKKTDNIPQTYFSMAKGPTCAETKRYNGPKKLQNNVASPDALRNAVRAYHATTFYMDAQIGIVLDALENSPAWDNTIVLLAGDHGYHLGDKGIYCKRSNYEQATRTPIIVVPPFRYTDAPRNKRSYAPVELLDIMPTLYSMSGINVDLSDYRDWQGVSLVPILNNPETGFVKAAAVSQYRRRKGSKSYMGHSVRTTRYRYTYWGPFEELYDYLDDELETISHHKRADLRRQVRNGAFFNGNFQQGTGQQPFDFADANRMLNKPPSKYA